MNYSINKTSLHELSLKFKSSIETNELYDWINRHLKKTFLKRTILHWAIIGYDKGTVTISVVLSDIKAKVPSNGTNSLVLKSNSFIVVQIVPTGIGAAFGGYAGDASPATKLLGTITDFVVNHPNTVNASDFYGGVENSLYVEGFSLDQFMIGNIGLLPVNSNRIGLIIDKADKSYINNILCAADAVRAVHGIDIIGYVITDKKIGGTAHKTSLGTYTGVIENQDVLLTAAEKLISKGANAIAIASEVRGISEDELINNYKGKTPHPIGGVEAIISRLVSSYFLIPSAHAPIINSTILDKNTNKFDYDPRSAGELISKTGLPCILLGLSKAPQILQIDKLKTEEHFLNNVLTINNVGAVVAPATAMGGVPMLVCEKRDIPIISVAENRTVLDVTGKKLGLKNEIKAATYLEAAGIIAALRAGIDIKSLRRPLTKLGNLT